MARDAFEFRWSVPKSGFRWIEGRIYENPSGTGSARLTQNSRLRDESEWVLTDDIAIGQLYELLQYAPFKLHSHSGLFRIFGSLAGTRDRILEFANEYGMLGIGRFSDAPVEQLMRKGRNLE